MNDIRKNYYIFFILCLFVAGFSGCETPSKPQNLEQSIAYSYGLHAGATQTVIALNRSKTITVQQAEMGLEISKQVKNGLDLSQALLRQGKPKDAEATFKMAETALKGLENFVKEYQK